MSLFQLLLITGATVALVTAIGIEGMRRWGVHRLLDVPNERSSHTRPTPKGGGLSIVLVALAVWVWAVGLDGLLGRPAGAALLVGTSLVLAVSWVDDLRALPFRGRLAVHLLAAAIVLMNAPPPSTVLLPGLGEVPLGFAAWPLAFIWVAGLTNAYNFMDGIDGIAGGEGVVAGAAWASIGFSLWSHTVGALAFFLAVGCAVFLLFNWSPARIFLGDVGSATLGFLFAVFPFVARELSEAPAVDTLWIAASAMVWPFVFDTGFTLVRRWRRGESVTQAHRSHLYQRLIIAGWSHARVSLLYIAWALTTSTAGWAMVRGTAWSGAVGLVWAVASGVLVWRLVVMQEQRLR